MEDDPPILHITAGLATLKRCDAKGWDLNQKGEVEIGRRRLVHVEQNSFRSSSLVAPVAIQTQRKFGNLFFLVGYEPNPWSRFIPLPPHTAATSRNRPCNPSQGPGEQGPWIPFPWTRSEKNSQVTDGAHCFNGWPVAHSNTVDLKETQQACWLTGVEVCSGMFWQGSCAQFTHFNLSRSIWSVEIEQPLLLQANTGWDK